MRKLSFILVFVLFASIAGACQSNAAPQAPAGQEAKLQVLAVESFLADLTTNVAGERAGVQALIPLGLDPHAFEPTPKDVARIAESDVLVVNGAGFEEWLDETIANAGGQRTLVVASQGLTPRQHAEPGDDEHTDDPHFWFDPSLVVRYVENIRDGLIAADPDGKQVYTRNAEEYIAALKALDAWAVEQVALVPPQARLLVTNHESFGYFADRYGFQVVGTVLPSVSTSASPSAKQMADLIALIRSTGAKAIFLETGANPELAQQISRETGVKVVEGLYSHSLSDPGGPAATYLDMMRYNIELIVGALK